jgi:lactate dehydrogenase-like 2-hydroxyacid dehydrogenase
MKLAQIQLRHADMGTTAKIYVHIAWLTVNTLQRSLAVAVENCRRLAAGETLLHRVV